MRTPHKPELKELQEKIKKEKTPAEVKSIEEVPSKLKKTETPEKFWKKKGGDKQKKKKTIVRTNLHESPPLEQRQVHELQQSNRPRGQGSSIKKKNSGG